MPPRPLMGQQFDDTLTLGAPGAPFDATGPFDWDDCYFMAVFIFQSDRAGDEAAASALGKPTIPAGERKWTLQVKETPSSTRHLKAGTALAVSVAVVRDRGSDTVFQWGQSIKLQDPA
ncbi:MAG TPA: hypothetical protein VMT59_11600 [Gaiellaceae bacterium]|nr:hypothetical protein [Gaiellaceae bacterium]